MQPVHIKEGASDVLDAIARAIESVEAAAPAPAYIRLTPDQYRQLQASPEFVRFDAADPSTRLFGLPFIVASDDELRAELAECLAKVRILQRLGAPYTDPAVLELLRRACDLKRCLGEL